MPRHTDFAAFVNPRALMTLIAVGLSGCATTENGSVAAGELSGGSNVGAVGPDFTQKRISGGKPVSLRELRGHVAIVDFWATWCEPCKKSFPKLQDLHTRYQATGLEVVGISEDDEPNGIPDFAASLGAKFPLAWDEGKTIASKWRPKSMPSTFIVDRGGRIRFVHFGYHDGEERAIEKEIKSLL